MQGTKSAHPVDLGAHWVGRTQTYVMDLVKRFNLGLRSQYLLGTKVMQVGDNRIRTYDSVLPNVGSWFALLELGWVINKMERLSGEINPLDPCRSVTRGEEWDSITVHGWLLSNTRYQAVRDVISAAIRCTFGADPSQMSLLYFLTLVKSAGGVHDLFEATEGAAQEYVLEDGAAAIVNSIEEDIKNDVNIVFDQAVNTIEQNEGGDVFVLTAGGKIIKCSRVIMCIPPPQQTKINWIPRLSTRKLVALNSCQMGLLIKVIVHYPENFWRQSGYSGEVVSSSRPVCICFDDSSDTSSALVTFIGGNTAVEMSDLSDSEIGTAVIGHLADCFGSWAYQYTEITVKNWAHQQFVEGSPSVIVQCGKMSYWPALRDVHDRVHFGGTETATSWIGYMDGAVQSGVRTALEVLNIIKPQSLSPLELKVESRFCVFAIIKI